MRYGFLVTHSSHLFAFPGYPAKVLLEAPIVLEALPQTILEMDVVPDLSDKNQMDITPASRTRLSRVSRAGRPKLQDDAIQDDSETTQRKTRMRLAQRRYRNKKQDALAATEEKAARLEAALAGTLEAFKNFQTYLIQKPPEQIPKTLALQICKTALEISSHSQNSGLRTIYRSPCLVSDCLAATQTRQVTAERFARASIEHSARLVSAGQSQDTCLIPEMLEPLQLTPTDVLMAQTLGQVSDTPIALLQDIQYTGAVTRMLPRLFRRIEEDDSTNNTVPRLPPPHLQQLKHGHTRTWLETSIPELRGEWLEAVDVEEYLAERGIIVREGSTSNIVKLQIGGASSTPKSSALGSDIELGPPEYAGLSPEYLTFNEQLAGVIDHLDNSSADFAVGHDPILDWSIFGKQVEEAVPVPSGYHTFTPPPIIWDKHQQPDAFTTHTQSTVPQLPDLEHVPGQITVHIDRLIEALAAKAICLGPAPGIRRADVDEAIQIAVQVSVIDR